MIPYFPQSIVPTVLFFDLETVPEVESFEMLSERKKKLWIITEGKIRAKDPSQAKGDGVLWPLAALYPEFGKIVVASFGIYNKNANTILTKTISSENESELLDKVANFIVEINSKIPFQTSLGGFNIENFDIPYLIKRFIMMKGSVPSEMAFYGKKPWDITIVDLAKVWMNIGFQDRYMIKLDLLAECLGVETSKDVIDGSDVYKAFYSGRLPEIATYCEKDVIVTTKCALKLAGMSADVKVTRI